MERQIYVRMQQHYQQKQINAYCQLLQHSFFQKQPLCTRYRWAWQLQAVFRNWSYTFSQNQFEKPALSLLRSPSLSLK